LFAGLFADLDSWGLAAWARLLGFEQVVNDAFADQVVRQFPTSVALLLGRRFRFQFGGKAWRRRRRLGLIDFAQESQETGLIGPELLALGAIQSTQQLIEPLLDAAQFAVPLVQEGQQFLDHPLQRYGIVRQMCVGGKSGSDGGVLAHAILDA